MGIGVSVFLLAVGAILAFAIDITIEGVDLTVIGIILMIVGVIGLIISLVMANNLTSQSDRTTREERY